ncbi:CobN/Magnesium chelatase-domain-containing protein [Tribonema minus]|uniref:magnesium chelatase n=1 Tax=Tribonema minus TaxID=303371 RepID=A0A835ZAH4_9STRA|nr:CobN/Magnesium chelatase-domain-containing protein [Tribonema minus]
MRRLAFTFCLCASVAPAASFTTAPVSTSKACFHKNVVCHARARSMDDGRRLLHMNRQQEPRKSSVQPLQALARDLVGGAAKRNAEQQRGSDGKQQEPLARIVLVAGFESFNLQLYNQVAERLREVCPELELTVLTDRDISEDRARVETVLARADAFFGSLIFDYDQVRFLAERIQRIPVRLIFESALELMSSTKIGEFTMAGGGGGGGPPAPVKALLSKFGSGKEEDRLAGYLNFLKVGPSLLKYVPGKKVADLRSWLEIYAYWNQGGLGNVLSMFLVLGDRYLLPKDTAPDPSTLVETPPQGVIHPDTSTIFETPRQYMDWYKGRQARATSSSTSNGSSSSLMLDGAPVAPVGAPVVAVLLYRKHVITGQGYIATLIKSFEEQGLLPVPIFINGVEAHTIVRDLLSSPFEQQQRARGIKGCETLRSADCVEVDAIVNTIGFPLVGGPAGSMEAGRRVDVATSILMTKNVPYMVAAPLLIQDLKSWRKVGVQGLQQVVLFSLPELDGAVDAVVLGGLVGDRIALVPERVRKLAGRVHGWTGLRRTPPSERKIAVLLYGFPPNVGAVGTAALLNVPQSLEALLRSMAEQGYDLGPFGDKIDGEALVAALKVMNQDAVVARGVSRLQAAVDHACSLGEECSYRVANKEGLAGARVVGQGIPPMDLDLYLSKRMTAKVERGWGGDLGSYKGVTTSANGEMVVAGLQLGNVFLGVQPLLGVEGDPMRLMFERDLTPHPQYAAFYKWLQGAGRGERGGFGAQAIVHFGMHGTVEWLPGSPLGNTFETWPDQLLGGMPNVYVYAANNPSESILAKRRGYGTIVSHNVPPYSRAGLYKELLSLKELIFEYRESPASNAPLRPTIAAQIARAGLFDDRPYPNAANGELSPEAAEAIATDDAVSEFDAYVADLGDYLLVLEQRLFSEGLHVLGAPPSPPQTLQYLSAFYEGGDVPAEALECAAHHSNRACCLKPLHLYCHCAEIKRLLELNTEELSGVLRALNGEYVPPGVGGDILRDGPGVLPTGRNMHALDPYRMPSPAAWARGQIAAAKIVEQHLEKTGSYPETIAVTMWGLDSIKTRGESVAIALALIGARPVKEATGRIVKYELVPLDELKRPRIDVLASLSGIFRDSFANVVDLLDDLFEAAATADEPTNLNYIRKHALDLTEQGIERSSSRLFSNPPGDFGSMVNERVGTGDWDNGDSLAETWQGRNSFSFGRGGERGTARPELLEGLLKTTDRIVQEIDSVEYGLTDIQEYFANTGALKRAAEVAKGPENRKKVGVSIIEAFSKKVEPQELEATLRLEYRSKMLNPKWAEAMAAQGSGGAYEISQRMTALIGWSGTADFQDQWVYDGVAERYALDPEMAQKLRKNNPEAFQNILKRMLEAAGRGFWSPDDRVLEAIREQYADIEDQIELGSGKFLEKIPERR